MILLVLHHPRAGGWVTSTSTSRKRPAKGAGRPRRAGHFELNASHLGVVVRACPPPVLLGGWDADTTDAAVQGLSKESVPGLP